MPRALLIVLLLGVGVSRAEEAPTPSDWHFTGNVVYSSRALDGANIIYSDYKVDLGYRILDGRTKLDLVGGYRLVNFAVDLEGTSGMIGADVSLEGPFLGIAATF